MIDISEAEDLFRSLRKSPHQPFRIESQCSIRARLMVADAILDHNIAPSDLSYIFLYTWNDRFKARPLPREVFDFEHLCQVADQTSFNYKEFRFSLVHTQAANGKIAHVKISRKDGTEIIPGYCKSDFLLNAYDGAPNYDHHWALGLNTTEGKKVCDPHTGDALMGIGEWQEVCGASHGVVVEAAIGGSFPKPYVDQSPRVKPIRPSMEAEREACVKILAPFRAYQDWRAANWGLGVNPRLANKMPGLIRQEL